MADWQYERDMDRVRGIKNEWRLIQISTCPNCYLRWDSDDPWHDFANVVICPECGVASQPGRGDREFLTYDFAWQQPRRRGLGLFGRGGR